MSEFIAPQFAGQPAALAQRYTAWLFGDKGGNPRFWNEPSRWPDAGIVTITDQSFNFAVSSADHPPFTVGRNMTTIDLNVGKGANTIVYSRSAYVTVTPVRGVGPAVDVRVPLQSWAYILVRQQIVEGYTEIGATSLVNVFGTATQPHTYPVPMMWAGNLKRTLSATIPLALEVTANIHLSFKIATLQTGR